VSSKKTETVSKRDVQQLLKDLDPLRSWGGDSDNPLWNRYQELDTQYDRMLEDFEASKKVRDLKRKVQAAKDAYERERGARASEVRALRQQFLAEGLTTAVLTKLSALVKKYNKGVGK